MTTLFDGPSLNKSDEVRLSGQLARVHSVMQSGHWFTFTELRNAIGGNASEAGVSARIRDLRKERFGGFTVERRRRGTGGLWEYRMVV